MPQVSFQAALAGTNTTAKWLSVDIDGASKIVLEADAEQLRAIQELIGSRGRLLRVTAEWDD